MNQNVIFFLIAVAIVAVLLLVIIFVTRKGPRPIDVDKYRVRWLAIEHGLKKDETSSYALSVLNADKLLDQALQDKGCGGKTMAERMKVVTPKWSDANAVWRAHKLRNQIAHEDGFTVSYESARQSLAAFKKALKEIGAL